MTAQARMKRIFPSEVWVAFGLSAISILIHLMIPGSKATISSWCCSEHSEASTSAVRYEAVIEPTSPSLRSVL